MSSIAANIEACKSTCRSLGPLAGKMAGLRAGKHMLATQRSIFGRYVRGSQLLRSGRFAKHTELWRRVSAQETSVVQESISFFLHTGPTDFEDVLDTSSEATRREFRR